MAGLMWKQNVKKGKPFFAASTSYVAPRGDQGDPNLGGIFNDASRGSFTTQIGIGSPQWALTGAWRYGQCGDSMTRRGTQFARQNLSCAYTEDGSAYTNISPSPVPGSPRRLASFPRSASAGVSAT